MPTYYDVSLGAAIPHGSDILNKPCQVVFTFPDGSHSHPYAATLFAWLRPALVRIVSPIMNIQAGWVGANGGVLSIDTGAAVLNFPITGFANVGSSGRLAPKVTGSATTELDQVISDLAWQDQFAYGVGLDAITGAGAGTALLPFTPKLRTVKSSSEHYRFVQSETELNREIEASASGKYNIEGITVNGSASYLSKLKFSELIITLVAEYESTYDGYDEADSYELTPAAKDLIGDPPKFRNAFGDYFVAGGRRSSRFLAVYCCQTTSVEQMDEFKASFGAEAPDVFSAQGSTRFMQAASQHNVSLSMDLFMDGYQGTPPSGPWSPEKILSALEWFKANEVGVDRFAKLKHYSTIVPSYPRAVNVAPDVFVELRELYTTLWDVRSLYASLPGYYQTQLKSEFMAVDYGIVANQGVLADDATKRQDYRVKADALLGQLNAVFDRMDFYFKVKQAIGSEPGNGQRIDETSSGQQIWLYGYSVYTKSPAIVISQTSLNYADSWHVGWREKTLELGPDGNKLLVGWQVTSNWGDGTNGGWWKAVDQILLTGHGAVHVTSLYDRGCDWTVTYFHVDAKDYQF